MTAASRLNRRLTAALAASLVGFTVLAQTAVAPRPTLVVGITVEGLGEDYLSLLRDYFGPDGFRRLLDNGVVITDLSYGPGMDATAATAMLATGANANVSGVPSATVFDASTRRARPVLGVGSGFSPKSLLVTTLADEVRISEGGLNGVYAVAPDAQQAVILAGHAGSSGVWISDVNGNWTSSAYYKELPVCVTDRNFRNSLASRLDTLRWQPVMEPARYPGIPAYRKAYPFKHTFPRNSVDRYKSFKLSAPVNREVTSVASDFIGSMKLGSRDVVDMISVAYTLAPYPYSKDVDSRLETMDAYLRLDADLGRLFHAIDSLGPGMDKTLVYLAGVPAPPADKRDEERYGVPHGVFTPRKAVSLLNVYLMAIHGNGEWVTGYHDNQIHFNAELAKERDVDMARLRREAADFLVRMEGVSRVLTIDDILAGNTGGAGEALRLNTVPDLAGDLFLTVTPGWEIESAETNGGLNARPMVSRLGTATYPAIIMAPGVDHRVLQENISATAITPTVARLLRIRSPNGAETAPLRLTNPLETSTPKD